MFEKQLEKFPEKEKHYQQQRKFLNDVGRRQNKMNNKTRQRLEKRQQESKFWKQSNFRQIKLTVKQL